LLLCLKSDAQIILRGGTVRGGTLGQAAAALGYSQTILADGPVAYYRLGEASGTVSHDASGNSYDMNILGTPLYSVPGAIFYDANTAMILTNQTVITNSLTSPFNFPLTNFSIECFIKATTTANPAVVIADFVSFGGDYYWFGLNAGFPSWNLQGSAGAQSFTGNIANDGFWHHIVVLNSATESALWMDGVKNASAASAGSCLPNGHLTFGQLGDFAGLYYTNGVDEVSFYNHALSSNQIVSHYAASGLEPIVRVISSGLRQTAEIILPPSFNASTIYPLILYHHGAQEDHTAPLADALKKSTIRRLAQSGWIIASSDAHSENWGNQAAVDDYHELLGYVFANYNIHTNGTIVLSQSMGGLSGLHQCTMRTAGNVETNISSWFGVYPACSLSNVYQNASFTSEINTAYGITGTPPNDYSTATAGFDPLLMSASSFSGLRMWWTASSGDTVVPQAANTDAMRTHLTGQMVDLGLREATGDHGDTSHFTHLFDDLQTERSALGE
jgi:hypothetical protein